MEVLVNQEERKVVSINWYEDVAQTDSALLCATVKQPISVGMDGSAMDFQLYTGVSQNKNCCDSMNQKNERREWTEFDKLEFVLFVMRAGDLWWKLL